MILNFNYFLYSQLVGKDSKPQSTETPLAKELFAPSSPESVIKTETPEPLNTMEPQGSIFDAPMQLASTVTEMTETMSEIKRTLDSFNQLAKSATYPVPGDNIYLTIVSRLEDFVAFLIGITTSTTVANFGAVCHLYFRSHYTEPVCLLIVTELSKLLSSDAMRPQASPTDDIISSLKGCIASWREHRSGPVATALSNIVSMLVAFRFLPDWQSTPLQLCGLELFKAAALPAQKNALSFVDLIIDTVILFLERGYAAIVTGDPRQLLYTDSKAMELEDEYTLLVSAVPLLKADRLHELNNYRDKIKDAADYEARVFRMIGIVLDLIRTTKPQHVGPLTLKLMNLKKLRSELMLLRNAQGMREKPFTMLIYGKSSVGKSAITAALMKVTLDKNGYASESRNVVAINDADKYDSEYQPFHTGVIFDDYGNTRAEHYEKAPTQRIIDFSNNVTKFAVKPDIESKGVCLICPKVMVVTTNEKDLMSSTFSNEPVSILRRFEVVMDVTLRPEYTSETGGLDSSKMKKFIEDAWFIKLQRVKIVRGSSADPNGTKADRYEFETILDGASLQECINWVVEASREHFKFQKNFVRSVGDLYSSEICDHCCVKQECGLCALVEEDKPVLTQQSEEEPLVDYKQLFAPLTYSRDDLSLEEACKEWYAQIDVSKLYCDATQKEKTFKQIFDDNRVTILSSLAVAGVSFLALLGILKVFKSGSQLRNLNDQGAVVSTPPSVAEPFVPSYPKETHSEWKKVRPVGAPRSQNSATTTLENLLDKIDDNLVEARVTPPGADKRITCHALPMCGTVWLFPEHMFKVEGDYHIEFVNSNPDRLGNVVSEVVNSSLFVRGSNDMIFINLLSGGPRYAFCKYLPLTMPTRGQGSFVLVDKIQQGKRHTHIGAIGPDQVTTTKGQTQFSGFNYTLPWTTYNGLCIAPLVSYSCILMGFHLAGNNTNGQGAAGVLTRTEFDRIMIQLRDKTCVAHSAGNFLTTQHGISFPLTTEIPVRHAVNFMRETELGQPSLEVLGAHSLGTATFRSDVNKSEISEDVEKVMGLPRMHGPPPTRNINTQWQKSLEAIAHPCAGFDTVAWEEAQDDLLQRIKDICESKPDEMTNITPLRWEYCLGGIDGVASIDRVDLSTSMGFPLNKPKRNFIEPIEAWIPNLTEPIDFTDPEFKQRFEELEEVLASGERVYPIHRANLKDEPTKFGKDKVRVFAGCQIVFTLLVRKYFLPIIKFIQDNPIQFECAVGVNVFSDRWEEIYQHLTQHGTDRIIAGDYKDFDKNASAKAMMYAFRALISIAEHAGYDERSINVMWGIATDISYPLYEYAGVFVQAFGSNPSGHPLTVIINNLENSGYLRFAYKTLYPGKDVPTFAEVVAALNYGDDNNMGVSKKIPDFTHTAIARILGGVGIQYTMADKSSESRPLIDISETSFLKRSYRYEPELGKHVAPLEESSLVKSLHCVKTSKRDVARETSRQAIINANREYFLHGKEVFNKRSPQLQQIADIHYPGTVLPGWDELIAKYKGQAPAPVILELTPQSGEEALAHLPMLSLDVSSCDLSDISPLTVYARPPTPLIQSDFHDGMRRGEETEMRAMLNVCILPTYVGLRRRDTEIDLVYQLSPFMHVYIEAKSRKKGSSGLNRQLEKQVRSRDSNEVVLAFVFYAAANTYTPKACSPEFPAILKKLKKSKAAVALGYTRFFDSLGTTYDDLDSGLKEGRIRIVPDYE